MSKQPVAIANCRVSSIEQLQNNSLSRQQISVNNAAKKLGVEIIYTWSGSVSSKAGTNIKRTDLMQMLAACKANKNIKYAIFDEYDRFMRSVNEGPYFEVLFQLEGVKVWYASESDSFNGDDAMAKFMRAMSAFKAEGSNEERQRKSISGQSTALNSGRYPFSPKPGYMKGTLRGVPEIHPVRGPALRSALTRIASYEVSPTDALIELNRSDYTLERAKIRMDKFRKIATDPFYAGIVEIRKQVNVKNDHGIHDPLITLEQHEELLKIFSNKKKNQSGPRKNGNPKYPMNSLVSHDTCLDLKNKGKFVGFDHGNGKNRNLVYEKYRCRTCGFILTREEMHDKVVKLFSENRLTQKGIEQLVEALGIVWREKEAQSKQDAMRLKQKINSTLMDINSRALAAIDPSNNSIKSEILSSVENMKLSVKEMEEELFHLEKKSDTDKETFIKFALNLVSDLGNNFLSISPEERKRCKDIIFPSGFLIDNQKNVYTHETSALVRLAIKKRDTNVSQMSHLVRVQGL